MQGFCRRWKETEKSEVTDEFPFVCAVFFVGRWVAGGLHKYMCVIAALWFVLFSLQRERSLWTKLFWWH